MSPLLGTLHRAAADPDMRRLQLASFGWSAGEAAYLVGVFVAAYGVAGPASVAAVAIIRTAPSVVLAPWMAGLAARRAVASSIRLTLGVRLVAVALLAAAIAIDAPLVVGASLVAIDSVAATLLRPLRGTALPAVARTPDELVAGNVALTTGDSLAGLAGPAIAAGVIVLGGPLATFVPGLLGLALASASAAGLHGGRLPASPPVRGDVRVAGDVRPAASASLVEPSGLASSPLATARWLAASPIRAVVLVFIVQRAARGALTVVTVAAAIDLLGMGGPGVGLLTAAMGLGGLAGGALAVALVGRRRLAPAFIVGVGSWGVGIAVIGIVPIAGIALVTLAAGGIGKVLIDVAGFTLLQRGLPNQWRTRVLGLQEGLVTAALAVGAAAASVLIETVGVAAAIVVVGALPVVTALMLAPRLRSVDDSMLVASDSSAMLRRLPLFEPLPLAAMEELAAGLSWHTAGPGEVIMRQGESGDRYYVVERGTVVVQSADGWERRLGPGDGFGEIALLRDVPRTATVTAVGEVRLAALERDRFLAAVTGDRTSAARADGVVEAHLSRDTG